jgi:hypothetical protein
VRCCVVLQMKGLARLPTGLTHLDVSSTQVTGHGLRCLSRLTALRDLNLASTTGLSIERLQVTSTSRLSPRLYTNGVCLPPGRSQWIPSSVEVLDLSFVSGPETQLRTPSPYAYACS